MERKDTVTVEPLKLDGEEISSTEVTLVGKPVEVAMLVAGLRSLRSAVDASQPVTGFDSTRAHEVIDGLIEQIETPTTEERVELGPEVIDEHYIQNLIRQP